MNPDTFHRFIGPRNLGKVLVDDELVTCLLDNGVQLNFIMPAYAQEWGMDIMSLDYLAEEIGGAIPHISGIGGISVEPVGFIMMNVKVPGIAGYDEDQIAIVMDDPGMMEWLVILGTPTIYRVMEVIKESEISKLAVPWVSSRISWLMRDVVAKLGQVKVNDIANKPIAPLHVDEVVRVVSKCMVPPFGHKAIHGKVNLVLHGYKMNVMTHGLEKQLPSLPLGIDVQTVYATLADGSSRITVVLRNNTRDWVEIKKGVPVARMVAANEVPKVTNLFSTEQKKEQPTLSETERQDLLLEKLDLSGLEAWPEEQAEQARSLLKEYHDMFSLEKRDMGHTNATEHKIVLKDPDTPPFKEHFCRILPPQLDEVREHLKLMLDAGVIRPSNSPWCNAVVLVRKKDGSLRFCIDFRKLNSLTVKDSHPLPRICETLESLTGAAHFSTFNMNSGFWQVPMAEDSKQYTAFTLGSMGLYECESMPFGLCNAPPTFQRLMQNCLGELNLTYCLIYLDDVIVFYDTPDEHLQRMHVVFDRLHEHGLKLKPSKCEVFKSEINYLAHHVSRKGVLPSKKNLESIAQCPPPDTYTKVKSFVGLVGHYRHFIKGFAKIAAPLYDLTSGDNKDKNSEHVDLPPEAREAFNHLKTACLQAPILSFPDFTKPFLLETDASGRGLGAILSQKLADGRYHPIAYASRVMNETEQRYHSNKQEFLALKWAITEQFHEYLSPYGKNRNEFVVQEAAHQGQCRFTALMQERFWWPGMTRDLRNCIKKCGHCRKYEAAPPVTPMKPLACSGPGELLHVDFTSIEETVPLKEDPVIRNVLVLQDHFSKYVVAYVVKDQTACTAAETLRIGYFGLFGAPAYLVSDQGKAFTGHVITHLCELYGVQKLRTSPYHAQTNGQVERMNQTIICMIGKLEEDRKACWSKHLPELLMAYNATRSAVTGYSPYYLLFSRRPRIPVDYLFPTLRDSPHQTKMEVSVAAMQKRLKEAFAVARHLTSEEVARQCRYYDRKAGAVALQPGDVVMVRTDGFVGKRKVKDRWENGGFIVESQLENWPVYKIKCPTSDDRQKPKYRILHRNRLLLVTDEDASSIPGQAQAKATPIVSNATPEAFPEGIGLLEKLLSSLVTRQGGDMTSRVWLNGKFHMKPWTQRVSEPPKSPPDLIGEEVSEPKSEFSDSLPEGT